MSKKESRKYVDSVVDGYDYGIFLADKALEHVMRVLRQD